MIVKIRGDYWGLAKYSKFVIKSAINFSKIKFQQKKGVK